MPYEDDRRVILGYQSLSDRIRRRVVGYVTRRWRGMGAWRDADIRQFVADIVPAVAAGQMQLSQLTDSYLDSMARLFGIPPPDAATLKDTALRGVDPDEEYRRAAVTMRTALSEGKPLSEAVRFGEARLASLVATDLQLARTHTARNKLADAHGIVGYRRTLTGTENCALCALASTQRYRKSDLMPIHPGCDCGVAPIAGDRDPGLVINEELYEQTMRVLEESGTQDTHAWSGKQYRTWKADRDVSRIITVRQHGEYGPTLTWRHHEFTSAADI